MRKNKYHLIGVGGSGLSGLAHFLLDEGNDVSGSEIQELSILKNLRTRGAKISLGHVETNIDKDINEVIYSLAIPETNCEIITAKRYNLPIKSYPQYLGKISKDKFTISVSGAHGKTTTAGFISYALSQAKLNPSFIVGGVLLNMKTNGRCKDSDLFVVEACEYRDSFLNISPSVAVITNIEGDHFDYFTSGLDQILQSFQKLMINAKNLIIANGDNHNVRQVAKTISDRKFIFYGSQDNNDWYFIQRNGHNAHSGSWPVENCFSVYKNNKLFADFNIKIPGVGNIYNALAAIIVLDYLGIDKDTIVGAIENFIGMERRFQFLWDKNRKNTIISDYAHHPTQIKFVYETAKSIFKNKKIVCVFQPHQQSRLKSLWKDFISVLSSIDHLIITDVYKAREYNNSANGVSSKELFDEISKMNSNVFYIPNLNDVPDYLSKNITGDEVIMILGAGDIIKLVEFLAATD